MPANRANAEKSDRIEIRLRPEDKRACELRAREMGLSLSAWIRVRLMIDRPLPKKE